MALMPRIRQLGALLRNTLQAAMTLPPLELPKGKRGQRTFPSFLKSASPSETVVTKTDRQPATTSPIASRTTGTTKSLLRELGYVNPALSGALSAYLRTGIPNDYTLYAQNPDGSFNRDATQAVLEILTRINLVQNYADGFSGMWTIQSLAEALGKELILEGAANMELVLDKALTPAYFAPVADSTVYMIPDKSSQFKWLRPIQRIGSAEIDLDVPTFFRVQLDVDLLDPTSNSPLEAALQPTYFSAQFMVDVSRVIRRAVYPRMDVVVDFDKLRASAPAEAQFDSDAMKKYQDGVLADLQSAIDSLEPEQALVHLNFIKPEYLTRGNVSLDRELDVLKGMADSQQATGAKVMPSVLGLGSGTQNIASTESMLFMKNANGMVRMKLNEIFSRGFTMALRLLGYDVSAVFAFDEIDLRPALELESFRQMRQSRVLDQLSLGFISDDEACLALTGRLTPAGYTPRSGTMFRPGAGTSTEGQNPYSGAPQGGGQSGGGAVNQNLKPQTPTQAPGKKTAEVLSLGR